MLNMAKVTKLKAAEVVDRAIAFFGPEGWGMDVVESSACCARLRGLGGFLLLQTEDIAESGDTRVEIQGTEIESEIREFMRALPD